MILLYDVKPGYHVEVLSAILLAFVMMTFLLFLLMLLLCWLFKTNLNRTITRKIFIGFMVVIAILSFNIFA